MTDSMESHCISFRDFPHTSPLYCDYLYDFSRVAGFYRHDPFSAQSLAAAGEVTIPADRRAAVADVLAEQNKKFGGDARCLENIERLRRPETLAVVTGQQVGLFGGPCYSVYKAMTAIQAAAQIHAAGKPAIPIFWLASEDHDFAEVNHTYFLDSQHRLLALRDDTQPRAHIPVGNISFGHAVGLLRDRLLSGWPRERQEEAESLLAGYAEGKSYADAFAHLFHQLFAGTGLVLLDPRHPTLYEQAKPLYSRALEEAGELRTLLLDRGKTIEKAGYRPQVHIGENHTLLFLAVEGERRPLRQRRGEFHLTGNGKQSLESLRTVLESEPERITPNALLRPVVQDFLLPTVAYVAGPGEIAYYAQASTLYDKLLGRMPIILPRKSLSLVEPRVQRLLGQYQLSLPDVFAGSASLHTRLAERRLPKRLQTRLRTAESKLEKMLGEVAGQVGGLDSTLMGAVETSKKKMLYQFGKIRGKAARAQAERTAIVDRHVEILSNSLYPHQGLQERKLNFLSFVGRYGASLTQRLMEQGSSPCRDHLVVFL